MGGESVLIDPTSPTDCVLLFGPPLTREAFEEDVACSEMQVSARLARGDYASSLARKQKHGGDVYRAWNEDGSVVAKLCRDLIQDAQSVGATVYETATAFNLAEAARNGAQVIVLIAHWKGARVTATDVRIEAVEAILASPSTDNSIESRVRTVLSDLVAKHGMRLRPAEIADSLNKLLCANAGYPIDDLGFVDLDSFMNDPDRAKAIGLARDRLDARFLDLIVPGNCLELRDGYHKASAIAELFGSSWTGIVELSVCFSVALALAIKQDRDGRRIITNERAKDPERCLPELSETFLLLSSGSYNYASIRSEVFSRYSGMLGGMQ